MKSLVIVESPTKAKTIGKFLGKEFTVTSSYGHVRDLPKSKMGVDFKNDFAPTYVVPLKAKQHVSELQKLAKKAKEVYFATDEDREGEAISWHLQQLFKLPDSKVQRITFHEITKKAILEALKEPHGLNKALVDAQQARRVLDRLVGYELSPLLWKKVARGLSAGRVQSVAVRLIVDREREIAAFIVKEFWTVEGTAEKSGVRFSVQLVSVDEKKLDKFDLNEASARAHAEVAQNKELTVTSVASRTMKKSAPAPFTTSGLQIEANRALGFSAKQTMVLAQQLYEGISLGPDGETGLITYMRTDSQNLADDFLTPAQEFIRSEFGEKYATGPRKYKSKSKNAQEAHEAIRPTDPTLTPERVKPYLERNQLKLYTLIWSRTLASQMPDAEALATTALLATGALTFKATGSVTTFDGWQKVYPVKNGADQDLPKLSEGDRAKLVEVSPLQHFTQPPARYSEAGLVKALEERGIGRPSTYAPTIATIVDRQYVEKTLERRLKPTEIGILVNDLLVEHFSEIVDYDFTAAMENDLDAIAKGEKEWQPVIKTFYEPFKRIVDAKDKELNKKDITEEATDEICDSCGKPMVIKFGRFGKFLACTGYPDCKKTKPIGSDGKPAEPETTDEVCEKCGKPMVVKRGRFGTFLGCSGYPDCKNIKNKEKSTGVSCPSCGKGDIIEKRSKRGRTFYSCNQYPKCTFALWSKPNGEQCPQCKSLLVYGAKDTIRCSNKECGFSKAAE